MAPLAAACPRPCQVVAHLSLLAHQLAWTPPARIMTHHLRLPPHLQLLMIVTQTRRGPRPARCDVTLPHLAERSHVHLATAKLLVL